jgi:hypothetical protein
MIIIKGLLYKEKRESLCEFFDRTRHSGHDDGFVEVAWSNPAVDETYLYDFEEQVYKKRKVYFHISNMPFAVIDAKIGKRVGSIPAAYFAMDISTCLDFFKHKFKNETAFLHRCVNNRAMNLFNPCSRFDLASLELDSESKVYFHRWLQTMQRDAKGKSIRYWNALERSDVMNLIYNRTDCDGIALDFYEANITRRQERTEGFCLFDRAVNAMKMIDIAKIDDVDNFNPERASFWPPNSPHLKHTLL